ncbi:MAG: 2Fe-2S iron-sulfur cluster-binding protein, partial [Alphaproteobacteria bacterium]
MAQARRLASPGRIDRTRPVTFSFNGRHYAGFAGDTLASALLVNGVGLVARSFKYHRPRGIVGAGLDEPNAIVDVIVGGIRLPNLLATEIELTEGLE